MKVKLIALAISLIGAIIIGSVISYYLKKEERAIFAINAAPVYTYGTIVAKNPHKRKSFIIDFKAEEGIYRFNTAVNQDTYEKYVLKDTIAIVYARNNPSRAVLVSRFKR